jgi:thiamine biosynthesis lipoprotein
MRVIKDAFRALGTDILILIVVENSAGIKKTKESLKIIRALYREKEQIFSRFDKASELNILNRLDGKFHEVSADMLAVVKKTLEYHEASQKLFDPRIIEILENIGYRKNFLENDFQVAALQDKKFSPLPVDLEIKRKSVKFNRRMDFSGIAKGYIADKITEFLNRQGWENFLVDSGGDIYAKGLDEKKEKWKIGLEGFPEEKIMLRLSDEAVATSGITRKKWTSGGKKFHHLINPHNIKKFDFDLKSVTVIQKNTTDADVWAKVLFLQGKEEGLKFSDRKKIPSLFLDRKGNLYLSQAAKKYLNN